LILNLNNFLKYWEFTMSTNFLTRVITKASTFILISTLLPLLIVNIHTSDALALDNTFDGDGLVTTSFSGGDDFGSGIAVQANGKIVVVGTSDNGSGASELAVARFNLDGSLDNSFSGDGRVTLSFTAGDDVGSGIAVQSDGKIVVVGTTDDLSNTWFAVARFNVNGSLDPSFAGGGTVISRSSKNGDDIGSGIAVQSNDEIVVVGSSDDGSGKWRFAVARFISIDGSFPDPDNIGKAITSFTAGDDIGSGIAVQSDGKIVVVGTADDGSGDSDFAVARYNPADLSLTGGGAVVEVAAASSQLRQIVRLL
jgi:uncharacterized delta-60 repeat protein